MYINHTQGIYAFSVCSDGHLPDTCFSSRKYCAFKDRQVSLNRDGKLWQTGPSLCHPRGFHWVCATSLECVLSTWASWPQSSAAQHRLTPFIRSLRLLCHIKTPHYLLLCHRNSARPSLFFLRLTCSTFSALSGSVCLFALCQRLLRQHQAAYSSFYSTGDWIKRRFFQESSWS